MYTSQKIALNIDSGRKKAKNTVFFHPDFSQNGFTVGIGIAPILHGVMLADCTAGGELHPALKNCIHVYIPYHWFQGLSRGKNYATL
jgi:hypothetical protein